MAGYWQSSFFLHFYEVKMAGYWQSSFFLHFYEVKMAGYWQSSFFLHFYGPVKRQKGTMLISSHRDSTVSVVCNTINPRRSFDVFVVFNIFCCSKFSLVLLSLHFISDNLSPSVPPWNTCHPPKSSTPSPLKINNDWCGPLNTICAGSFIDVILEK